MTDRALLLRIPLEVMATLLDLPDDIHLAWVGYDGPRNLALFCLRGDNLPLRAEGMAPQPYIIHQGEIGVDTRLPDDLIDIFNGSLS